MNENEELLSNCCGAAAEGNEDYGICPDCKEHCEFIAEEETTGPGISYDDTLQCTEDMERSQGLID